MQENYFFNNQDFVDFKVYRPAGSTERFLTGSNLITPDGTFNPADTNELIRIDNASSDTPVSFDGNWRFSPVSHIGYAGLVDPSFTNELAFIWNESKSPDFTWKPRNDVVPGAYSLFLGGNGLSGTYGTINQNTFEYRFVLQSNPNPSNTHTQSMYDTMWLIPPQ